jgi:predicted RNA polymerase sigma factor
VRNPDSEQRRLAALAELLTQTTRPGRATPCQQLQEVDLPIIAIHPALSTESQRILLLRCALWFEPQEIGRIADLPAASVDTRLRTAYRRLRSVGLGDPVPRDGLLERVLSCLGVLEELYWRAEELMGTDRSLASALRDAVVRRTQLLARQAGAVGGEANALLGFFAFTAARLGRESPTSQDGWWHLRAAEGAGAAGRYLWLARILATYVTADTTATVDWRSIALMWERVQELERPSTRHWLARPSSRQLVESRAVSEWPGGRVGSAG